MVTGRLVIMLAGLPKWPKWDLRLEKELMGLMLLAILLLLLGKGLLLGLLHLYRCLFLEGSCIIVDYRRKYMRFH